MRKKPLLQTIDYALNDKFSNEPVVTETRTITDSNNKFSIASGVSSFPSYYPEWQHVPIETLKEISSTAFKKDKRYKEGYRPINIAAIFILINYFLTTCQFSGLEGAIEGTHILNDSPTIWRFTFTPPNGEPRQIAVEHDDLTPAKLAELCK